MHFVLITALTENGGIGYNQNLPWPKKLSIDMTFFRFITSETTWDFTHEDDSLDIIFKDDISKDSLQNTQNALIMGRKTFESVHMLGIPPFKNRVNIVLSSNKLSHPEIQSFEKLNEAFNFTMNPENRISHCFVIGGGKIYQHSIAHPSCKYIIVTQLFNHPDFPIDTWFPISKLNSCFKLKKNITLKVLERLVSWKGTGKLAREVIHSNLERYTHNTNILNTDPYVVEHDISFRFLLYEHGDLK